MKNKFFLFCALNFFCVVHSYADPISQIVDELQTVEGYEKSSMGSLSDIDNLTSSLKDAMTKTNGWGQYKLQDFQSYGAGGANWSDVLNMAKSGGGSGALGQVMSGVSQEFPSNQPLINKVVTDSTTQNYYAEQSQTVVANRAAGQLDFNNIQKQIDQQSDLRKNVGQTTDLKSSVDLLSRNQIEGNMINLQLLRQITASNQQQALNTQGELNDEQLNANFLQKP